MEERGFYRSLWRHLQEPEPNLVLRLALSLVTGAVLLAGAILAAWGYAMSTGNRYVRDEHIAVTTILAGIGWLVILLLIWRSMRRGRPFVVPAIATLGIFALVLAASFAIDELLRIRDEEFLILVVVLLGSAGVILVWLPTIHRVLRGQTVVGTDDLVCVHCPKCGYSLIGLRGLRCPECGTEFTIDELIRAQNYGGVPKVSADEAEQLNGPRLRATADGDDTGGQSEAEA